MKRSQALDVVRGIAITIVLIWHYLPREPSITPTWLINSTSLFWSGVDLFFVLSGFLIAGILLQNVSTRNYFSTFYIRRVARIFPLYSLILGGVLISIYFASRFPPNIFGKHLPFWSYLLFMQNFLYAARGNFKDPLIDVTWSLAVEEQFYIFLSLLIRYVSKVKIAIVAVVLSILALILRLYAPNFLVAYLLPLHRADSLMLGVLLALIWQWDKGREYLYENAVLFRWSCLVLFLVVASLTYLHVSFGDASGHT
jgi:peptidoglycan/LPS O-acetylase OafA/YrhL